MTNAERQSAGKRAGVRAVGLVGVAALLGVFLTSGFVWGFFVARDHVFPYAQLKRLVKGPSPADERVFATPTVDELAALESLGYVDGTYDPESERSGVLIHDRDRAQPGWNLYGSRKRREALLIDMDGREVYRWSRDDTEPWNHFTLLSDGDLIVVVKDREILRLDRDSRIRWRLAGRFHHDLDVQPDGAIFALTTHVEPMPELGFGQPVMTSYVTVVDAGGGVREEHSVARLFAEGPYAFLLPRFAPGHGPAAGKELDLLHVNHVEVLHGDDPVFGRGHVLLSVRQLNAVVVADLATREILWLWGPGNLLYQHHARWLANGNILVFDNGPGRSRVVELDPRTRQIVWQYGPVEGFYTETRGSNQRLANGNTLITESNSGRVFEVTADGEVVWLFENPDVNERGIRGAIWRMERFGRAELPFLREARLFPGVDVP